ncbi:hypothetical protein TL16_g07070 [Triparma laevis f. inornata]|uniref:Glycerol-3-phosphate dehydrogenase n=1 Tax=Triparma laevis f. inornata TaxID=1714386 RepID=A0A9W7AYU5_9STRA|nr:hypothetical protein TL16_g07070 [Triparma laevis f. inornata]
MHTRLVPVLPRHYAALTRTRFLPQFNITNPTPSDKTCDSCPNQTTCPRSRTRHVSVKDDGTYDVVIVGGGCVGASIARELTKYNLSILLLESADDVTQGATKGNSGIVHAGFDDKPGSVRAKYCWPGNQILVLAKTKEERKVLDDLMERGRKNGVQRLKILEGKSVFEIEPFCNPNTIAALHSPDAGNLIPYEFAIAMAENAADNGAEVRIRRTVSAIEATDAGFEVTADHWEPKSYAKTMHGSEATVPEPEVNDSKAVPAAVIAALGAAGAGFLKSQPQFTDEMAMGVAAAALVLALIVFLSSSAKPNRVQGEGKAKDSRKPVGTGGSRVSVDEMMVGGSGSMSANDGVVVGTEKIKFIVNAAGGGSDKISAMIGDDSFTIKPRLGDYLLLNREQGYLAKHTLFPCPDPVLGKGVLVQTTLWGNLILGPTARDTYLKDKMDMTDEDVQKFILSKCKDLVPDFDSKQVIHGFVGARAKNSTGDWIIEESKVNSNFIQAAGIDSPGLAGSPAIAVEVVRLLQKNGLSKAKTKNFNPNRAPIITPKDGWKGIKAGPVGKFTDPKVNVICKCEKVTEHEVITALRRSLPIDSTQGIRKRTRAGMGHCQGDAENYNCECRVADVIARENGYGKKEEVGRRPWPATSTLPQRWLEESEKENLVELAKK